MRAMSSKRRRELAQRRVVVEFVLSRDNGCRAQPVLAHLCMGPWDVHEIVPRSAWKAGYLEPDNCITVCRWAHDWIGANPTKAHELRLHGYSFERPGGHLGRDVA